MANIEKIIEKLINKPESYSLQKDSLDSYIERHKMFLNPFADKIINDRMFINKDKVVVGRIMRGKSVV